MILFLEALPQIDQAFRSKVSTLRRRDEENEEGWGKAQNECFENPRDVINKRPEVFIDISKPSR